MQDFIISLTSFLFVIFVMVSLHEWGHFFIARLCGVRIDVFGIGFGKTLWVRADGKGTAWKINLLPLGGYVKMFGAGDPEEINKMIEDEKKLSFFHKKLWQKTAIVFAGPLMNYLLAFAVMVLLLFTYGDKTISTKISMIEKDSPAEKSGLLVGDVITSINQIPVKNIFDVKKIIASQGDNTDLIINLNRNGIEEHFPIKPEKITLLKGETTFKLGIGCSEEQIQYGFFDSVKQAAIKIYFLNNLMIDGVIKFLIGQGSKDDLGGPIKIAKITGEAAKQGMQAFLELMILLSLNLGLLNLLPIPGLDGWHLMCYLVNAVMGKPIPDKVQAILVKIGLLLLIGLVLFLTLNDIFNL